MLTLTLLLFHFAQVTAAALRVLPAERGYAVLVQQMPFCRSLLRERPGSEALWYLRRSLLQQLLAALCSRSRCVVRASPARAESPEPEGAQPLAIEGERDQLWLAVTVPAAEGSGGEETDSDSAIAALLQTRSAHMPPDSQAVLAALDSLLLSELQFVQRCATDISVWNFQLQRTFALRYALHCVRAGAAAARDVSAARGGSSNGEDGSVGSLLVRLEVAATGLKARLAQEDCFERCWAEV